MFLEGVVVELKVQRKAKNKDHVHRQTLHVEGIIDIYEHAATSIAPANLFKMFRYGQNFVRMSSEIDLPWSPVCALLI